jgi:hypothetical protein
MKPIKTKFPVLVLLVCIGFFVATFFINLGGKANLPTQSSARSLVMQQRLNVENKVIKDGKQSYQFESSDPLPYFEKENIENTQK